MTINIDDLIKLGEGYHLEFKESVDKSFAKEVCAFANASGGKILLGVIDKGFKKNIVLDNQLHSRIQDTINHIEPRCHTTVSQADGVVMIDIAAGFEKPYGCSEGFFIRIGANSQKLTRNVEGFSKFLIYNAPSGNVRVEAFIHNENIWLTQDKIAVYFITLMLLSQLDIVSTQLKQPIFVFGQLNV